MIHGQIFLHSRSFSFGPFVSVFEYRCPFPHFPFGRPEALSFTVVEYSHKDGATLSRGGFF